MMTQVQTPIDTTVQGRRGAEPTGVLAWAARGFGGLVRALRDASERRQAEDELYRMDDRMLHDLGISRSQIPAIVRGEVVGYAPAFNTVRVRATGNDNGARRAA